MSSGGSQAEGSPGPASNCVWAIKKFGVNGSRKRNRKIREVKACAEPRTEAQSEVRLSALVCPSPYLIHVMLPYAGC